MNAPGGKSNARSNLVRTALWACLLGAVCPWLPGAASAQQVVVVGDETPVRLDPSAASPAIATLAAGTVLEWVGESGPYYVVSVPGGPGQEDLVGYVLAAEVEVAGPPDESGTPPPGPNAAVPVPGVGRQHANAKRSRAGGLSKAVWGAALATAAQLTLSIGFEVEDEGSYADSSSYRRAQDRRSTAKSVTDVAVIGGAALLAYGIGSYVVGWRKMAALEREFPEATTPPLDRRYAEARLGRSLGRRKVLFGGLLAGAAWGSSEWVPQLAVPKPEDFKTDVAYQNALDRREKVERARTWVVGAGGVLVAWGIAQWFLSGQRMGEIEDISRTTALAPPPEPSGSGPAVATLFLERADARTRLGVAWRW